MPDRRERLNRAQAKIEEQLGDSVTVGDVHEIATPFHIKRPTGIASMDIALGGGFPGGVLVQVHGKEGVGKTGLVLLCAATSQRMFGDDAFSFFSSFGYKVDASLARLVGMQIAYSDDELRGLGHDPEDPPEELAAVETVGVMKYIDITNDEIAKNAPAEAIFEAVAELLESGAFQIGIVDELGSGETRDDVVKHFRDEKRMASWARLMTNFCIRMYTKYRTPLDDGSPIDTTLFVVNPSRANINTTGGRVFKQTKETSGRALAHAKAIDVHLTKGKSKKRGTEVVSFEVKWTIAKGKHGIPTGAKGEYIWLKDEGPDIWTDLAQQAKKYSVVRQAGRYMTVKLQATEEEIESEDVETDSDGFKTLRYTGGIGGFIGALRADDELFFDVYHATLTEALGYNPLLAAFEQEE